MFFFLFWKPLFDFKVIDLTFILLILFKYPIIGEFHNYLVTVLRNTLVLKLLRPVRRAEQL